LDSELKFSEKLVKHCKKSRKVLNPMLCTQRKKKSKEEMHFCCHGFGPIPPPLQTGKASASHIERRNTEGGSPIMVLLANANERKMGELL
jgi:hypothetical protein